MFFAELGILVWMIIITIMLIGFKDETKEND